MRWLKIDPDLVNKPETQYVADYLGLSPREAVGVLVEFWGWVDQHTEDGHIPLASPTRIDRIMRVNGFAQAMIRAGWMTERDKGGVTITNFDRHMGSSAKRRAMDSERKRASRSCPQNVREMSASEADKSVTREEKKREEKNKDNTPSPKARVSDDQAGGIYDLYPRKAGRKAAIPKIKQAITERGYDAIREAVERFARSPAGNRGKYTPHPATWFNQGRYDDDPETWNLKDEQHDHRTDKAGREFDESDLTVPVINGRSLRTGT